MQYIVFFISFSLSVSKKFRLGVASRVPLYTCRKSRRLRGGKPASSSSSRLFKEDDPTFRLYLFILTAVCSLCATSSWLRKIFFQMYRAHWPYSSHVFVFSSSPFCYSASPPRHPFWSPVTTQCVWAWLCVRVRAYMCVCVCECERVLICVLCLHKSEGPQAGENV